MIDWSFLFKIMAAIGFPSKFNNMVQLLFQDATTIVKTNAVSSPTFKIE